MEIDDLETPTEPSTAQKKRTRNSATEKSSSKKKKTSNNDDVSTMLKRLIEELLTNIPILAKSWKKRMRRMLHQIPENFYISLI
jgi:hypothetical protein